MSDILFLKELVPVRYEFFAEVVSLVDQQDELLLFANFLNVLLQVLRVEEVRVATIDYLE